jgi:hypothetical protein
MRDFVNDKDNFWGQCYFAIGGDADATMEEADADSAEDELCPDVKEDNDALAFKLMRHVLFALADVNANTYKIILAIVVRIFGRSCLLGKCESDACVFKHCTATVEDRTSLLASDRLGGWFIDTNTSVALMAKAVYAFRMRACVTGNRETLDRVIQEHMRVLAYTVSQSHPRSAFAKAFGLFKSHMLIKNKYYGLMSRDAIPALSRIDGARPFFPSEPEESSPESEALDDTIDALVPLVFREEQRPGKKTKTDGDTAAVPAPGEVGRQDSDSHQNPEVAAAAATAAPAAAAKPVKLELSDICKNRAETDSVTQVLRVIEEGERGNVDGETTRSTPRIGRVMLASATRVKLVDFTRKDGGSGDRKGECSSRTLTAPHTVASYADMVYYPRADGAFKFDGGGEKTAADHIQQLKATGRIVNLPDIDNPSKTIQAEQLEQVPRVTGHGVYNTFRGFYAQHAFFANHPTDTDHTGVAEPELELSAECEDMLATEYVRWTASMTLPTIGVFFRASLAADKYEAAARLVEATCTATTAMLQKACDEHRPAAGTIDAYMTNALGTPDYSGGTDGGWIRDVAEIVAQKTTLKDIADEITTRWEAEPDKMKVRRNGAVLLKAAAASYEDTTSAYETMMHEYHKWRTSNKGSPPSEYVEKEEPHLRERQRATLMLFGYICVPGRDTVGIDAIFQAEGEAQCFGKFEVLPLCKPVSRGVLQVANALDDGFVGFRVRGHLPHTFTTVHRFVFLDAVRTHVDTAASWAPKTEAAQRWLPPAHEVVAPEISTVCAVDAEDCTVRVTNGLGDETTLHYARHPVANEFGSAVPPVFSLAHELVFEANTRCPRGITPDVAGAHGVERLKEGDLVQFWTTEGCGVPCIVAARHWSLHTGAAPECALVEGEGDELVVELADVGTPTPEEITPALGMMLVEGFIIRNRDRSTIIVYLFSPTSAGESEGNRSGQGSGKSMRQQMYAKKILGLANSEIVGDYEKQIEKNDFSDKGVDKIYLIYDELPNFAKLTSVHTKSLVTNEKHDARIKFVQKNVTSESFINTAANGNEVPPLETHADTQAQRRGMWVRVFMPNFGRTMWWSYILGTYMSVSPTILYGIHGFLKRLAESHPMTPNQLQDCVAGPIRKRFWNGQTPIYIQFLKALHAAPLVAEDMGERREQTGMRSILAGMVRHDEQKKYSTSDVDGAAREFLTHVFGMGAARRATPSSVAKNAAQIVNTIKRMAHEKADSAWGKLFKDGVFCLSKAAIRDALAEERHVV